MTTLRQCPMCASPLAPVFRGQDYFCTACVAAVCQDDEVTYVYCLQTEETIFLGTSALLATEQRARYTPAGGGGSSAACSVGA